MEHHSNENLQNIGQWFQRKIRHLSDRQRAASAALNNAGISLGTLREEWGKQKAFQMLELPREYYASFLSSPFIH